MERIEQIRNHPLYVSNQQRIDAMEVNRIFCCHGVNHSLDVARILYIMVLEQGLSYKKDIIYATALLHDIGRGLQYEENVSHHEVGARLANDILKDCDFSKDEITMITKAIAGHHTGKAYSESADNTEVQSKTVSRLVDEEKNECSVFIDLFYKADKMSRNCFDCKASEECYWSQEKRNLCIRY